MSSIGQGAAGERVGVLGGTFDPPHNGHLALARAAREQLGLDRVVLMPVHTPPHKEIEPGSARPEDRVAMAKLAAGGCQGVGVCEAEVRRGGRSYTVDTLKEIHDASPDTILTLIVGADMALMFGRWREPERLLELASLAVASREGAGRRQAAEALRELGAPEERVSFLRMDPVEVSSSLVRERLAAGESVDGLVPEAVGRYIAEHGLYSSAGEPVGRG